MDAGLLDMLHDAGDVGVLAVGEAIDIDLDGVGEIAVDQQRPLVGDRKLRRPVEIGGEPRRGSGRAGCASCTISMARPPST